MFNKLASPCLPFVLLLKQCWTDSRVTVDTRQFAFTGFFTQASILDSGRTAVSQVQPAKYF